LPLYFAPFVSNDIVFTAIILMLLAHILALSPSSASKRNYRVLAKSREADDNISYCLLLPFFDQSIVIGLY